MHHLLKIIEKQHEPKVVVHAFGGFLDPEVYLDWIDQLKKSFEQKHVKDFTKFKCAATNLTCHTLVGGII